MTKFSRTTTAGEMNITLSHEETNNEGVTNIFYEITRFIATYI